MSNKQPARLPQIDQVLIRRVGDGFRVSVMAAGRSSPVDLDCSSKEEVAAVTAGFTVLMRADADRDDLSPVQRSIAAAFLQAAESPEPGPAPLRLVQASEQRSSTGIAAAFDCR